MIGTRFKSNAAKNRLGEIQALKGKANRFRVYRFCASYMEKNFRAPSATDVADTLGLSVTTCIKNMKALEGAKGLPYRFDISPGSNHTGGFGANNNNGLMSVDHYMTRRSN